MRVWVDITDASHVVFFAPIVRRLEEAGPRGHGDGAALRRRRRSPAPVRPRWGAHHGAPRRRRGDRAPSGSSIAQPSFSAPPPAAASTWPPAATPATSSWRHGRWASRSSPFSTTTARGAATASTCASSTRSPSPRRSARTRIEAFGAPPDKLFRYPGFAEEYYLYDVRPDADVLARFAPGPHDVVGVVRPPRVTGGPVGPGTRPAARGGARRGAPARPRRRPRRAQQRTAGPRGQGRGAARALPRSARRKASWRRPGRCPTR